jgi:hypothetical protein
MRISDRPVLVRAREDEQTKSARQLLELLIAEKLREIVSEDPQRIHSAFERVDKDRVGVRCSWTGEAERQRASRIGAFVRLDQEVVAVAGRHRNTGCDTRPERALEDLPDEKQLLVRELRRRDDAEP